MADINNVSLSAGSGPTVNYTITYTKSRPSNTQMTYNFTISAALAYASSGIGSGLALNCTMTVNGSSNTVRIKAADGDNWTGTTPRIRTVSVTCSSSTANANQAVTFKVVSDGRATITSGVIDNSSYTVTSAALLATAPTAPTSVSLTPNIFESTGAGLVMTWSGATGGINNAIQGYQVYNNYSNDNVNWTETNWGAGNVTRIESSGTSIARGQYFRIRIVAKGVTQNSGFSAYSNTVRHNTLPKAPTTFTASPASYLNENITLSWSGAVAGTSSISKYTIEQSISTNGSTWGSWTALSTINSSATSGSTTISPTRTAGTYTRYRIRVTDTLGAVSDEWKTSNNILCTFTPCTAPTSLSVNSTLSEGNVTLSWSGAGAGTGGPIAGYQIQYSDSTNGSSWGAWTDLSFYSTKSTNGSTSVAPPTTRGNYRRFRIRTDATTGSAFDSGWKESSNTVRRNTLPTAPTTFKASPDVLKSGGAVTLTWSGAKAGTSTIKNYVLQVSTSTNNSTWGSWTALATVTSTATSGSHTYTPSLSASYVRYRICVTDALDCISDYFVSNTIRKNSPPPTPTITAPKAGTSTYNPQPRILITLGTEPDGDRQMLCVKTASGVWQDSVSNASNFSRSGWLGDTVAVKYRHDALTPGAKSIAVKAKDEGEQAESGETSRSFTIRASPFAEIIPNETPVKAEHITVTRTAVNHVRAYYGLAAVAWQEEIAAGRTQIVNWSLHIIEIRKAVEQIVDTINRYDTVTKFDVTVPKWISIEPGRPKSAVMIQIHELILSL